MFKKTSIILFYVFLAFISVIGLWWLALFIAAAGAFYWMFQQKWKWVVAFRRQKIITYSLMIPGAALFAIWYRVFVFQVLMVPSSSMENTIIPGDKIVLSKLHFGPRMPRSPFEIPWINLIFYMNTDMRQYHDMNWWKPMRLSGFRYYRNDDILIFIHPDKRQVFIKRAIGLPGDTLQTVAGLVYINGKELKEAEGIKHRYTLKGENEMALRNVLDSLHIFPRANGENYNAVLSKKQAAILKEMPEINEIAISPIMMDTISRTYPNHPEILWSEDFYGPLIIPKQGWTVPLNRQTYLLYRQVIAKHEGASLRWKRGRCYLEGEVVKNYTFQKDYFFMMGDYRHDSNDSRYWGFVPEENILGKAAFVLYSNHHGKFRWDRLFHRL